MKITRILLILVLLNIFPLISYGQSDVKLKIQLLTPDLIGNVTLDKKPFFNWLKKINNEVKNYLKTEDGDKEILVLVLLHKKKSATVKIGARPELSKSGIKKLFKIISKHKFPRTKITDYSFAIIAKLNNGCKEKKMHFTPPVSFPAKNNFSVFKKMSLADKKKALQSWVENEVIPVVAKYENMAKPKFKGVLSIGEILEQKQYLDTAIDKLTIDNYNYWRAVMEMNRGNQLIPFSAICMHIARAEFDIANRLLFVVRSFSDKKSLPVVYYKKMSKKLNLLNRELGIAIKKGIALHDKGKYQEAVAHYEALLKVFPKSAWLNYELYFSKTDGMKTKVDKEWNKYKKIIYKCDPMYYLNVRASSGKEGYLLLRRREINSLFKSQDTFKTDFIKYADIAFDLKNYGFAAQLYWLILNYIPKEDYNNRNILAYYLYCLEKLGIKGIAKNFKGNFSSEFKKIEAERKVIMQKSKVYKVFKIKE